MALKIHFKSGPLKGHTLDFDDDQEEITFGRDPDRCQVVLPMSAIQVSREHCALERVLGKYRLVLNGENPVYLDGEPGQEGKVLKPLTELQLGKDGPRMLVETITDDRLRATVVLEADRPHTPLTLRQHLKKSVFTNRIIAMVAVVLVLATVLFTILKSRIYQEQVQDVEKKLESTRVEISTLSAKERENIANVLKKITEEDPIRRFRELISRVEPSIYLVMLQTGKDMYLAMGTAWVVKKGVLATNAHVAEQFEKLTKGRKLVVRSSSTTPRDFEVKRIQLHPGYHQFKQTVANHMPLDPGTTNPSSFIPACDVGLLYVDGGEDLGPPLLTEPLDTLTDLRAGEGVAFVGYPIEGVRLRDVTRPQPTSQIGHITSLTDVFNGKTLPAKQHLVRHNLPLTGGTSGSPLLNRNGKVVAVVSAGTFHLISNPLTGMPERIPTAVGINFAQRVDLLQELLDGKAETIQQKRTREWVAELVRYKSGRITGTKILEKLRRQFELQVRSRGVKVKSIEQVLEKKGKILKPGQKAGVAFQVEIPHTGYYLISAIAEEVKDIDIAVIKGASRPVTEEMRDHYPSVSMKLTAGDKLKILVYLKPTKLPTTNFVLVISRAVEK